MHDNACRAHRAAPASRVCACHARSPPRSFFASPAGAAVLAELATADPAVVILDRPVLQLPRRACACARSAQVGLQRWGGVRSVGKGSVAQSVVCDWKAACPPRSPWCSPGVLSVHPQRGIGVLRLDEAHPSLVDALVDVWADRSKLATHHGLRAHAAHGAPPIPSAPLPRRTPARSLCRSACGPSRAAASRRREPPALVMAGREPHARKSACRARRSCLCARRSSARTQSRRR